MRALLIAAIVCAGASARADLPLTARGSATVTGGDAAAAKARALDDAFRQAVEQAVATLVAPAAREASADVIKKRVLRRARTYVPRYKVVSEGVAEGVYAITVDAQVADGLLAADLQALGVGAPPAAPPGPEPPPQPPPRAAARPTLALLAVSSDGEHSFATFGRSAAAGPGPVGAALERELAARGFRIAPAAGLDVPLSSEASAGGLPIDVTQAASLARQAGAGGALVAAALIKDGGRIRGTRAVGAEVDLALRLDDAASGTFAEERVSGAGFGSDGATAAAAAGKAAALRAGRALAARLESHWPEPAAGPAREGVLVRLRGVSRGADVDAVSRALATTPGARLVVPARYARREVTLLVRGASARSLAEVLGASALADLRVRARAAATEVEVELSRDAAPPPAPLPQQ